MMELVLHKMLIMVHNFNRILFVTSFNYDPGTQQAISTKSLVTINTIAAIVYTILGPIAIQTTYDIIVKSSSQSIASYVSIMQISMGYITVWTTIIFNIYHSSEIATFVNDMGKVLRLAKTHYQNYFNKLFNTTFAFKIFVVFVATILQFVLYLMKNSYSTSISETIRHAYLVYIQIVFAAFMTSMFLVVLAFQGCLILIENFLRVAAENNSSCEVIEEMEYFYTNVHKCSQNFARIFGLQLHFHITDTYMQSIAQIFGFFDNMFSQRGLKYVELVSFVAMFGVFYWFIAICGRLPMFAKRIELTLYKHYVVKGDALDGFVRRQVIVLMGFQYLMEFIINILL